MINGVENGKVGIDIIAMKIHISNTNANTSIQTTVITTKLVANIHHTQVPKPGIKASAPLITPKITEMHRNITHSRAIMKRIG